MDAFFLFIVVICSFSAAHPEDELFATAGMDKAIILWRKQKLIWNVAVEFECISLAFHPYGSALVVGTTAGNLLVLSVESGEVLSTVRVCAAALNCMAFNQGTTTWSLYFCAIYILTINLKLCKDSVKESELFLTHFLQIYCKKFSILLLFICYKSDSVKKNIYFFTTNHLFFFLLLFSFESNSII